MVPCMPFSNRHLHPLRYGQMLGWASAVLHAIVCAWYAFAAVKDFASSTAVVNESNDDLMTFSMSTDR
ncbi:hypothetical protein ATCV1_z600L [Acanthocystis turfacea chlorella virus 1]|uniref:Uncharacterized protein z600L n=1 Tax=Chlorovirus heliozoae TaxID=322019 RepID=A7K9L0_9PHYC|nr:hypothetical protein ATCV1_z600L [Acanthocystis turfacea chlorella virus 1]ABT16734.1 hypothetical protein ATCV1_z600L [Acanthocystis turfacea chlorella virus 1]